MRVVIDASVWVAALQTNNKKSASRIIYEAWSEARITPVFCDGTFDELRDVLANPKFRLTEIDRAFFLSSIERTSAIVAETGRTFGCRDPFDDPLLDAAVEGQATYLVSLDKDILEPGFVATAKSVGVTVLSAAAFLRLLRSVGIVVGDAVQPQVSYLRETTFSEELEHLFDSLRISGSNLRVHDALPLEDDDIEIAMHFQIRDAMLDEVNKDLELIRDVFTLNEDDAKKRLVLAKKAAASKGIEKLELLVHQGENALKRSGVFIDDILPEGAAHRYVDAKIVYRGVAARSR